MAFVVTARWTATEGSDRTREFFVTVESEHATSPTVESRSEPDT